MSRARGTTFAAVALCLTLAANADAQRRGDSGSEPNARCAGHRADVVGTKKSEKLKLGPKQHVVAALGGDDMVTGSGSGDIICTGGGGDRVFAGSGDDTIDAGSGDDAISGGSGLDRIGGGGGADRLSGGKQADAIDGGPGADLILTGGAKDRASGGAGDDVLVGARGNDRLSGGSGADEVDGGVSDDRMQGGAGDDKLLGDTGTDRIAAGEGSDTLEAGPGPDLITAGGGADQIFGETGGDIIDAGDGDDLVLGGAGGDQLGGGRGDDRLYGELVDDEIKAGPGNDLLVGGHGVDSMHGGADDDWLRGDVNLDFFWGDEGTDTVSYATSTPPGPTPGPNGVVANLQSGHAGEDPQTLTVDGNDPLEQLHTSESLVGSNYEDVLTGRGQGSVRGLGGPDLCSGFLSSGCNGSPGPTPNVTMQTAAPDPGLLVSGGPGAQTDSLALSFTATDYVVTSNVPISAGAGCSNSSAVVVSCPKPSLPLGYATVWGGAGPDTITLAQSFPETAVVVLNGGPGDDVITGSSGSEVLLAGPDGRDRLSGGGGDDALFTGPGGDLLDGGSGNDQLVGDTPCEGHDFEGGEGDGDIAGFAQTTDYGVAATVGGQAIGRGVSPCTPTTVRADNEILEGTQHDDVLVGDNRDNALILGNEGSDVLIGKGGADVLKGERGADALYGGPGADELEAFDLQRDLALFCGPGGHDVTRDPYDPPGAGCSDKPRTKK